MNSISELAALARDLLAGAEELALQQRQQPQPLENAAGTIRGARRAQRLSQAELADLAGVSAATVKRIEAGRTEIALSNVMKVMDVLGLRLWIG